MPATEPIARAIHTLAERHDLDAGLAEEAFGQVMAGAASGVQMAALLMGLRTKGETADEVVGAVRALRSAMVTVSADQTFLVDTCGTGGGRVGTFNISTAAAFVAAGAGARLAKHGNRSFTSQSGSADVLEALGVSLPTTAAQAERLLIESGMTFLFAPHFHPAMRHVGPIRRELAMHTVMNILGPLANPAVVRRQVVGVADPGRAALIATALTKLGTQRAFVVHARAGMDEIAPVGLTDVWEVEGDTVRTWTLDPERLALGSGDLSELAGGTPAHNADVVTGILGGEDRGLRASAVVVNAAAALMAAGVATTWEEAVEQAREAVRSGRARDVLERMRRVSTSE